MLKNRSVQFLVIFLLIFAIIYLMSLTSFIFDPLFKYVGAVAVPFIGAGVLYYATKPLMSFFEKLKFNRIISIILIFLLLISLIALFILYIFPIAQKQFYNLMDNIPKMVDISLRYVEQFQTNQFEMPEQVDQTLRKFMDNIQSHVEDIMSYLFGFIGHVITFITSIVLIPFFLFFMLKDGHKFIPFITQILDKKRAENVESLLRKIDETLTAFIQGQLLVSFFLGILLFIGYVIIGLKYSLTLALFGMIMNVIPFLGPFIAVIPALIVAAFESPMMVIWVAVVTLIAQQFESNFISPNVMGRVLALHPLTVITVILAAGSIAGFLGILFAVPFYAVIKTIVVHFYHTYKKAGESSHLT